MTAKPADSQGLPSQASRRTREFIQRSIKKYPGVWGFAGALLPIGAALVLGPIVFFAPSDLEEGAPIQAVNPEQILLEKTKEPSIAPGIPKKIPEYSVDQFQYLSVQGGAKQWRLQARTANMYGGEKLVHARTVTAYLYDGEQEGTVITGKEARYFLNEQDLEIYGDVKTVFSDGFELYSQYLRYKPRLRKIEIPIKYPVKGKGNEKEDQHIEFDSSGLDYILGESQVSLPRDVRFTLTRQRPEKDDKTERTVIESDKALIFRDLQRADFAMFENRKPEERFVHITQPTLFARARRAEIFYGERSKDPQILRYLTAYEDVLIKEKEAPAPTRKGKKGAKTPQAEAKELRYSTSGRADFDSKRDVIILKEYPQVYQGQDTVTGDTVIMHRDSDIVEVENSNAYSDNE